MNMITRNEILEANEAGLRNRATENYWNYYTPVLQAAFCLGYEGVDLSNAPEVSGYRYGAAPESFLSYNYADNTKEIGLSLACVDGEKEIGSSIWFKDRKKHNYSGIVSGKGSDGEILILCYQAENLDK